MSTAFSAVDEALKNAQGRDFTGAVARIEHGGRVVFERAYGVTRADALARDVYADTRFDLASLTKLFVTTLALQLVGANELALDVPLWPILLEWRESESSRITLRMLLSHTSGMTSGADYREILGENVEQFALRSPLIERPGGRVVYSDFGFIATGALLERVAARSLAAMLHQSFPSASVGFRPRLPARTWIPATEEDGWRGRVQGFVHDEKAYLMGGVAGHAGIFGTAADVAALTEAYLGTLHGRENALLPVALVAEAVSEQAYDPVLRRGLGWALKTNDENSCGRLMGVTTFGHTGFVGTCVWADPERDVQGVLLTNSVYFGRSDTRDMRARFFEAMIAGSKAVVIAVGLMSGTSLDGIDAALVEIVPDGERYRVRLIRFETYAFDANLEFALRGALPPNDGGVAVVAALHHALGEAYAAAAASVAGSTALDFVASHGQTLWHDGPRNITLQLGDPFVIREVTGVTVCYDFRSADCAAGGHGAPLVPYVDAMLFGAPGEDRVALNLGGIANVTLLGAGAPWEQTRGFDTGPANMLLDAWVRRRTDERQSFDAGGALAANGRVDDELLEAMLADAYFSAAPPKTAGRERFGTHFLDRHARRLDSLSLEDGAATLTELTATSIAAAVGAAGFERARLIVSGGGAHNAELLRRIAARLGDARVETSDAMGISPDAKEAVAFALLGYELLRGRCANVPAVTGAHHAALLGALAPANLASLLAAIERECATS